MLNDLDIAPEGPAELRAVNRLLVDEVKALTLKVEQFQHQLADHNRHRFGSKSEGLDKINLTFPEDGQIADAAEAQAKPATSLQEDKPERRHSRKPLPEHLERNDRILSLGEEYHHYGGTLKTLGEDVTEELEYVPGRFVVNRIVRPSVAYSCCEAIIQSPLPSCPIDRSRPGPGFLAHVMVTKYSDHLPLYRQSQIFVREGIDLDRCWPIGWADRRRCRNRLLMPLADWCAREKFFSPTIHR